MSNETKEHNCGHNLVDWDGDGNCITCARDKIADPLGDMFEAMGVDVIDVSNQMSSTDTNQASEDDVRKQINKIFDETRIDYEGVYEPRAEELLIELIRTEKLKLLAEVRERVVGENDYQPGNPAPDLVEHNQLVRDGLRFEQRVELNKLEAEL